jgi:hypothetical protein
MDTEEGYYEDGPYDAEDEEMEQRMREIEIQNKEAARQLSIILIKRGISVRLISNRGDAVNTVIRLGMDNKNLWIYWRSYPEKIGAELSCVKEISEGFVIDEDAQKDYLPERCVGIVFPDLSIQLEAADPETCFALHLCLKTLLSETSAMDSTRVHESLVEKAMRTASYRIALEKERLYQQSCFLECTEGALIMENFINRTYFYQLKHCFNHWTQFTKHSNLKAMNEDKDRWRLHAISNEDIDLQAWYHAAFFNEVYRLRGPFWYREAVLPEYKKSYDLIENALTPLEEAALAHVLCSPETTYGDVACQMYLVQELVSKDEFALFQKLATQGVQVVKYPRSGRPAKKTFRISFVEGKVYLTWRGKYGNQGVDLVSVTNIFHGINSEILVKSAKPELADNYLSLISEGRSVDLCYESQEERELWENVLIVLVEKEQGVLRGYEDVHA